MILFSLIIKTKKISKGFTLMELLVSTMIFTVAVVLFSQIYVNVLKTERIAYGFLHNISGLEYVVDFMTKEIRMGKNFQIQGNTSLVFKNRNNENIRYYLYNNQIYREVNNQSFPISPLGINVNNLKFEFQGNTPLRRITITLTFSTSFKEGLTTLTTMKTSVTPRLIYTIVSP